MAGTLGSISGNIVISGKQAIAEYAAVRAANAATVDALTAASGTFAKVGTLALGGGVAIAALFGLAIDQAAQFQKKIDYFGAVTGATQADMDAVAAKALAMSKTTVFSADQMADAMVDFGKAGLTTQQILGGVVDATAALAQAAGINIADASNIIVSVMDTFHIKASDAISISNELAGAANASIIDVSDLATSLKYAGGVAEAAGIPMNSVVTALALLGNAGIKGSQGGTILRQVMVSLTAPTAAAKKELIALGVEGANGMNLLIDSTGKLKPLDQIFQILKEHTEGLTQAQTLAATKTIFNSRALAGANILLQGGAAAFNTMNAAIAGTSAMDVASRRLDNLAGDTTKFKNAVSTALIEAGGPLQNMLRGIVQWATRLVDAWGNLSPSTQALTLKILAGVAAFLLVVGALSMFVAVVLRVIILSKQIYMAFKLMWAGIMLLRDGFIMLQLVMEANPLILLVTIAIVVIGALVLMYFKFKWFRDFVNAAFHDIVSWAEWFWHHVVDIFTTVLNWIEGHWRLLVSIIGGPLAAVVILVIDHWTSIKNFVMKIVNDVLSFLQTVWHGIINYIVDPIVAAWNVVSNAFQKAYDFVVRIISDVLSWIDQHWRLLLAIMLGPLGLIIDAITNHLSWCKKIFMDVFDFIKNYLVGIWNFYYNIFDTILTAIVNRVKQAWDIIWAGIQYAWNLISSFFQTEWAGIQLAFNTALSFIENLISTVWNAIYTATMVTWNAIVNFFTPIISTIRDGLVSAFNFLLGVVKSVWSSISTAISTAYNATINPITAAIHTAVKMVQDAINSLKNIWTDCWNGIQRIIQAVWGIIKPIIDKIQSAIGGVTSTIKGIASVGGKVSDFFGFDKGGTVPGRKGQPQLAIVHGGEEVISNDMLSGRTPIPSRVLSALAGAQLANSAAMQSLMAMTSNSQATSGSAFMRPTSSAVRSQSTSSSNDNSVNVDKVINYFPKPDTSAESLPRSIRKLAYLSGGPR